MIRPNLCEQPVQVFEVRHIALYRRHAGSDRLDRLVYFLLAAPGHVNMSPLRDEPFCACQPDAPVRAGDDRNLSFKSAHGVLNSLMMSANLWSCSSLFQYAPFGKYQ